MDELLKLLEQDALLSPEKMADMTGLSADEIRARIRDYEDRRIILGYKAVLDQHAMDENFVRAAIEVKLLPERNGGFNRVAERVARFPQVRSVYLMSGACDLLMFVEGPNLREVASFVSETLSTIGGVTSTATHFVLKTYKEHGMIMGGTEEHERLKISP